jgi:hypothetical protein
VAVVIAFKRPPVVSEQELQHLYNLRQAKKFLDESLETLERQIDAKVQQGALAPGWNVTSNKVD